MFDFGEDTQRVLDEMDKILSVDTDYVADDQNESGDEIEVI
jgi:hypothetical protein